MKDLKYFEQAAKEAMNEAILEGKIRGYLFISPDYTYFYSKKNDLYRTQVVRYYFSPENGLEFNGRTLA